MTAMGRTVVCCMLLMMACAASADAQAQSLFGNGFEGTSNRTTPLGNNLDGVTDFASSYNFVDVMKQSRTWITQDTQGGIFDTEDADCLDLDSNGYVQSMTPLSGCAAPNYNAVATLFFFGDLNGHYPSGRYVVTYEGQGTISYHFAATKNLALSTPGRDVLDVNAANGGWMMRIDAITAGDHPRNMHVWMPGFDETTGPAQRFHPDFLSLIANNRVLRFMDWMGTNGSAAEHFVDRPQVDDVRWTEGKMPIEVMVDLANRVNADPWFNMPHRATDDYMAQFAMQVKSLLRADRRVYVEYSNEVWNGQFSQGNYIEAQGTATFGAQGSGFDRRLNWHGLRTAQMCDLWKAAWGAQANRVVCVLGTQAANAYTQTQAADCPMWTAGQPCTAHGLDAVAIAPYFGGYIGEPANQSVVQGWTLDDLFAELNSGGQLSGGPSGGAIAETADWIASHRSAANTRALSLIAYEGGQHLVGIFGVENNNAITDLLTSANRDPRMGQAYANYLTQWKAQGGELFVHFTASGDYSKWGSWGAVEFLDEPNTAKQQTLLDFGLSHPCWWQGCAD